MQVTSTKSAPSGRRWKWIIGILVFLAIVLFVGTRWLEKAVLERSERIMTQASGPRSTIEIGGVDIDLLQGDIRWTDLHIQQRQDPSDTVSDRAMHVSGSVKVVAVRGLSLWRLLFANTLSMRSLTIDQPRLTAFLRTDTADLRPASTGTLVLSALNADSLVVEQAVLGVRRVADSLDISFDSLNLCVTGLRSRWPEDKPFEVHLGAAMGRIRGIAASLPPLYRLRIARVDLSDDGRTLSMTDATITPQESAQGYDQVVHYETDLIALHLDTAFIHELDLVALVTGRSLSAGSMRMAGVDMDVSRDKTMPDGPYQRKPLPARILRQLPIALCMDSLIVERWNVKYHEKSTLTPDFGEVEFTDIRGVVRGVCSSDTSTSDTLVVNATARGFDRADVALEVRTVIADSSDRFTVDATVGRLPFTVFNGMTADLLLVRATAGTIGAVHLTMSANNERSNGRVDMEYNGLKLELLKKDGSGKPRRFLSDVMNQVLRGKNLRSGKEFRHGDFSFDRKKDRSFFNYLWSGLREGMIVTVLPGVLEDVRQMDQPGK